MSNRDNIIDSIAIYLYDKFEYTEHRYDSFDDACLEAEEYLIEHEAQGETHDVYGMPVIRQYFPHTETNSECLR